MSDKPIRLHFADLATYSSTDKTAISVRDGVLEYLGAELGMEPADRVFTVYRSPATIANAAYRMPGIPLTDEHVELEAPAPDTGSNVVSSEVVDAIDEATSSRLAVRNKLTVAEPVEHLLTEKNQLSLGYTADLVPHSRWDFEQIDIIPHHLAAVENGRCGPLCCFLDRKPIKPQEGNDMPKIHKAFTDAEGAVSLEQVVEIATNLPEAIRKVPVDKLQELIPAMQEIMGYAKEQGAMPAEEDTGNTDEGTDKNEEEDMADEDKPKFSDSQFKDKVKERVEKEKAKFADAEVKRYAKVVDKAKDFLDESYEFADKSANQIMRDALATEHGDQEFSDEHLDVAFSMLKKSAPDYSKFGDSNPDGSLTSRIKSQIKEAS